MQTVPRPNVLVMSEAECPHAQHERLQYVFDQLQKAGFDLQQPFSYDVSGEITVFRQPI